MIAIQKGGKLCYVFLFVSGITVGDELVIDGGMAIFEVIEKIENGLRCKCMDPGLLLPRAKLSFWRKGKLVEKNHELPTLSTKVNLSGTSVPNFV